MKTSVLDVLLYLFEHNFEDQGDLGTDQDVLKFELRHAGFADGQVKKAFDWLEGLAQRKELISRDGPVDRPPLRLFSREEMEKLDIDCRGFILFLEQAGILDASDREMVVDRLMALDTEEIDIQQLQWVVLMVLLNQPGKEAAYTWMEDVYMAGIAPGVH